MDYHSASKKKERKKERRLQYATPWMNLEHIMLVEIRQSPKDKHYVFLLIWGF